MRIYAARATEDPSRSELSKPGVNRLSSTAQHWLGTGEQKLPSTEGRVLESNQLLHLQRTIGNHRVGELLGRAYGIAFLVGSSVHPEQETVLPRLRTQHRLSQIPSFASAPVGLWAKLTVGPPEDRYEQEADRVADQVRRVPDPHAHRKTPGHAPVEPVRPRRCRCKRPDPAKRLRNARGAAGGLEICPGQAGDQPARKPV